MTPKVPLSRCRRCPHYRGYCPLTDLDPCPYDATAKKLRRKETARIVAVALSAAALAAAILASCTKPAGPEPQVPPPYPVVSAVQLLHAQHTTTDNTK